MDDKKKPDPRAVPLGTGMADQAKKNIMTYNNTMEQRMRELGLEVSNHAQKNGYDKHSM